MRRLRQMLSGSHLDIMKGLIELHLFTVENFVKQT